MFDSWTSRVIASVVLFVCFAIYRSDQNEKYTKFLQTPEGNAQALARAEIEKIQACGIAAKKGALGPGCQPGPGPSITEIYIPPNWASVRENN